jgi:hypothetical protein
LPVGFSRLADFRISAADREKIQKAFGPLIPDDVWHEIETETRRMLWLAEAEHSARPMSESLEHIDRLRTAAKHLLAAFTTPSAYTMAKVIEEDGTIRRVPVPETSASNFAMELIDNELSQIAGFTSDEFHDYLGSFVVACDRAPSRSASMAVKGTDHPAWDNWIEAMKGICARNRWPTGAGKDTDKQKRVPPFLVLVRELHRLFPHKYRRGGLSAGAIAKHVHKVDRFRSHTRSGTQKPRKRKP